MRDRGGVSQSRPEFARQVHERIGITAVKSQVEDRLGKREVVLLQVVVQTSAGAAEVGYPRVAADASAWEANDCNSSENENQKRTLSTTSRMIVVRTKRECTNRTKIMCHCLTGEYDDIGKLVGRQQSSNVLDRLRRSLPDGHAPPTATGVGQARGRSDRHGGRYGHPA